MVGAIYFGDEIRNPGREMPRSMLNGVFLLSAMLVPMMPRFFTCSASPASQKENLPIAALGQAIFGTLGNTAVRADGRRAVGLINCAELCATRVLYAMSRDGWGARGIAA